MEIHDSDRKVYRQDGVICLRQMFSSGWLDFLAAAIDKAMASPGPLAEEYTPAGGKGRFFGDVEVARRVQEFRTFYQQSPAAEIAGKVMGSSQVNFFYDQLIVKEPGTSERTPWHQDQPYWAVSGFDICSIWLPLDPISREVSVEYIKGSHLWPAHNPYHFADGSPYQDTGLPPLPDIDANRDAYDIVTFAMSPGDCLVFQGMIVHGAPGNPGNSRRRALATRWSGDDARYCIRPGEIAIPSEDPGLQHGDRLDSERFPVVWRSAHHP